MRTFPFGGLLITVSLLSACTTEVVSGGDGGTSSNSSSGASKPGSSSSGSVGSCSDHHPTVTNVQGSCGVSDAYTCGAVGYGIRCFCLGAAGGRDYCDCLDANGETSRSVGFSGCGSCNYDGASLAQACGYPY